MPVFTCDVCEKCFASVSQQKFHEKSKAHLARIKNESIPEPREKRKYTRKTTDDKKPDEKSKIDKIKNLILSFA